MIALAPLTGQLFDKVAAMQCINPYYLVGGTALALQLHTRLSEDLDFRDWKSAKTQNQEVDWVSIEKELKKIGTIQARDILTTKNLLALLTDGSRFQIDSGFEQLNLVYKVSPADVEDYLKKMVKELYLKI